MQAKRAGEIGREFTVGPAVQRIILLEQFAADDITIPRRVENAIARVLLGDVNAVVRHEAAFVLGRIASRTRRLGRAARSALFLSAKEDRSPIVRHEAAESLGRLPGRGARKVLLELLEDPNADVSATARIALDFRRSTAWQKR